MTEPARNTSIISSRALQRAFGDSPAEKPTLESILDELRTLSRELKAICIHMDKHFNESKASQEWQMIVVVIDRLMLCFYIVFIIATYIAIISTWTRSYFYAP